MACCAIPTIVVLASFINAALQFGRDGEVVIVDGDEGVGLALAADKDAFTGINLVK